MAKFFYHKDHDVIYPFMESTAEQVRNGWNSDLIIVEEDDERVQRLLPESRRIKKEPEVKRAKKVVDLDAASAE